MSANPMLKTILWAVVAYTGLNSNVETESSTKASVIPGKLSSEVIRCQRDSTGSLQFHNRFKGQRQIGSPDQPSTDFLL